MKILFCCIFILSSILSQAIAGEPPSSLTQVKALQMANETIGREIGNYTLIDQDGRQFNLRDLIGRPFIVSFIYTSCPHICPTITGNLARAVKAGGKGLAELRVITVGFDTERDIPQRMKEYGERFANIKGWTFATSDNETIQRITRDFGFYYQKVGGGFDHLNMITIVDAKGRIARHIYGMEFKTEEILMALKEVGSGKRGLPELTWLIDKVRLTCYRYDPITKTYIFDYSFVIETVLTGITILAIFLLVWGKELRAILSQLLKIKG